MDEINEQLNKIFNEGIELKLECQEINIEVLIEICGFYYRKN